MAHTISGAAHAAHDPRMNGGTTGGDGGYAVLCTVLVYAICSVCRRLRLDYLAEP